MDGRDLFKVLPVISLSRELANLFGVYAASIALHTSCQRTHPVACEELSAVRGHEPPIRLHAARIDLLTPVPLKLIHFPAHSPLPIAALPSMSLSPKAPFDLSVSHLCMPRRSLGEGGSLASLRLHSPWQITILSPAQLRFRFDSRPS